MTSQTVFDFNDAWEFIRDVCVAAVDVCRMPSLWIPAIAFSIGVDLAASLIEWPFRKGTDFASPHTITIFILLILAKGWFGLTLCRVALAGLRGQVASIGIQWVSVQEALRIGLVTIVLFLPIMVGFLFLIAPGMILLSRWSQTTLVLIDEKAHGFEATDQSQALTAGYRAAILILLMALSTVTLIIEYLVHDITPLAWLYRAGGTLIGAALAAAMYYELSRRAPWNPEAL